MPKGREHALRDQLAKRFSAATQDDDARANPLACCEVATAVTADDRASSRYAM
jgi:hypothetical protein